MTKREIIDFLKANGITELNRGESVADAIAFAKGQIPERRGEKK